MANWDYFTPMGGDITLLVTGDGAHLLGNICIIQICNPKKCTPSWTKTFQQVSFDSLGFWFPIFVFLLLGGISIMAGQPTPP